MAYDNPDGLIAAAVIVQLIVFACAGVRIASRRKLRQRLSVADWIILGGVFFGLGLTVIQIYGCAVRSFGVPLDASLQDPKAVTGRLNIAKHLELSYLLLGILALGTVKLSISFFYLQIFGSNSLYKKVIIAWILVLVAWTASFVIAGLTECGSHLKALFGTPEQYLDHCGSAIPSGYAMVGSNLATDVITWILPIPMIWALQMPLHRKLLVAATFAVGLLSVGASVAKSYIYIAASKGIYTMDAILLLTALGTWNLVEVQVGIVAACAPTMKPILKDVMPRRESLINLLDSLRDSLVKSSNTSTTTSEKRNSRAGSDISSTFPGSKKSPFSSTSEIDAPPRVAQRAGEEGMENVYFHRSSGFATNSSMV